MKRISCPEQFKTHVIEYHSLFGYSLMGEKNLPFSRVKLEFKREECDAKIKEVEFKYRLRPFLTFYPLAVGCFIILILATLFLIFSLKGNGDKFTYFLMFMVPTFSILPLIAIYTYLRYSFDSKNIKVLYDLPYIKKELGGYSDGQK